MTEAGKQKNEEVGAKARHCKGIGLRTTYVYGLADNGWTRSSLPPTHSFLPLPC